MSEKTNLISPDKCHLTLHHGQHNPYLAAATSSNTRRAYRTDIAHFEQSGGRLPATPEDIAHYLHQQAEQFNPRTLSRRLTALKNWHVYQGFDDPTHHPMIRKMLSGIMRVHGKPKKQATPLLFTDIQKINGFLQQSTRLPDCRDNTLIQIGFFGAFRSSELIHIHYEHINFLEKGIEILIPHSKTDQEHKGQHTVILANPDGLCPVYTLTRWLNQAKIASGPIFRRIIQDEKIGNKALTPLALNQIIKLRAQQAGFNNPTQYSSHSLRRGLATSAAQHGASLPAIMRQGRWKNVNTVMEYIEAAERFTDNVATKFK